VRNNNENLTLSNLEVTGNTATGNAGAVFSYNYYAGFCNISNCTFSGNKSNGGGGGAVQMVFARDSTIQNCTFNGNNASTNGGAITVVGSQGTGLTLTNDTIAANTAGINGGGLFMGAAVRNGKLFPAQVTLINSIVS